MRTNTAGKKNKLVEEMKSMMLVFIYLALLLGALVNYRRLISANYHISYFHYGYALVESLVLAKIIVVGQLLKLGDRFNDRPLIIPVLYKTLLFGILILGFSVLEHLLAGWWDGKGSGAVLWEIFSGRKWEIMANVLMLAISLLPLFAIWEVGRVLGEGKLFALFFKRIAVVTLQAPVGPGLDPPQ